MYSLRFLCYNESTNRRCLDMRKISVLLILALLCMPFAAQAAPEKPVFRGAPEKREPKATATPAPTHEPADKKPVFRGASEKRESAAPTTPAPTREPVDYGDPLLNIAMEMVWGVHELAGDENYHSMMMGNTDHSFLPGIAATDCTDLRSAQRIEIGASFIMIVANMFGGRLSPTGNAAVKASTPSMFYSMWNGNQGALALSEQAICTWERTFLAPENFSSCEMLLDCGGALYWVAFAETGDGIITVTAAPLFMRNDNTVEDIFDSANEIIPILRPEQIYP